MRSPHHIPQGRNKEAQDGEALGYGVSNKHRPVVLLFSVVHPSAPQLGSPRDKPLHFKLHGGEVT